jgi:hypothetical protein
VEIRGTSHGTVLGPSPTRHNCFLERPAGKEKLLGLSYAEQKCSVTIGSRKENNQEEIREIRGRRRSMSIAMSLRMMIDGIARLGHDVARTHVPVIGALGEIIFQSQRGKWRVC